MDVIAAYREVGTYRGAAAICGTTHKTVKRIIERHEAASRGAGRRRGPRGHNYDAVAELVAERGEEDRGADLGEAAAAGWRGRRAMRGRPRNFRRLVAEAKQAWRRGQHRGRPSSGGVGAGGDAGHRLGRRRAGCTCSARCWPGRGCGSSGSPTTRRPTTTLALLAECFEVLGGVPQGGAGRPDGLPEGRGGRQRGGADPGLRPVRHPLRVPARLLRGRRPGVEGDRGEPGRLRQGRPDGPLSSTTTRGRVRVDLAGANAAAAAWCAEVNAAVALGDLRGPGRAAGHRAGAAGARCRRCGPRSARSRSPARSTSCPVSGSARPATRCRPG